MITQVRIFTFILWIHDPRVNTTRCIYLCQVFRKNFIKKFIPSGQSDEISIDIGEKHTVTSLLPDCALAVHSSMSACDSMQAAITLTCMARNSLTL